MGNTFPGMDQDALDAAVDLIGRTGARGFEVGFLGDDAPAAKARWYAHAQYAGARVIAENHPGPGRSRRSARTTPAHRRQVHALPRHRHAVRCAQEGHHVPLPACRREVDTRLRRSS